MRRVPPRPTAQGAFFDYLREIHDYLQAVQPMPGVGTRLSYTTRGTIIDAPARGTDGGGGASDPGTLEVARFRVRTVGRSVLLCHQMNGSTEGTTEVVVAKPAELDPARATGDGNGIASYTYENAAGTPSEVAGTTRWRGAATQSRETVNPAYVASAAGSIIFAMRGVTGGLGLTYAGTAVEWQDMNVDGRAFVTNLYVYRVCINGFYKDVMLRGSNPAA